MPSDRRKTCAVMALFMVTLLGAGSALAQTPRRPWRAPAPSGTPAGSQPAAATAAPAAATAPSAPVPAAVPVPAAAATAPAPAKAAPGPALKNGEDTLPPSAGDPFFDADDDEAEDNSEIEKRSRWVKQHRDREDPRLHQNRPVAATGSEPPPPQPKTLIKNADPPPRPVQPTVPPKQEQPNPTRTVEQIIRRSEIGKDFYEMVDEMLDEIAYQLSKEDAKQISPMAIRMVRLSPNIQPEFARTLESRVLARIGRATEIQMAVCIECTAMRSRVEDGQWMVNLGVTRQEDLQRLARGIGVKTFLDISFSFSDAAQVMWLEAAAFRASDGGVVWTDAFRSDATTAALLRTGRRVPSRFERAAELERKLAARPNYGYMIALGMMQFGYSGATGDIAGANMTLRFHERFGENQGNLFGLSAGVFTTANTDLSKALNSILLGAYYSHNLSEPNLNQPEFWLYGEGGGIFSGNQGNTFYVESGGDLHLKWRLSLGAGLTYVFPTKYMSGELGGFGYRIRLAFNW